LLEEALFDARAMWTHRDLAVLRADYVSEQR
jgi:hypothetical protein